ncbi:MAG: Gfo/Idh/MocA family oxidoreductase [Actinomycetota bacterium]|nr:Gfo/Idh/MocA family oxidoreductase [Actinomycetota bacterium]
MNVGVVGCGYWGSKHVRVLHGISDVERVVGIDNSEDRLLTLKRSFPSMLLHSSLEAALPDVDALVIATPPRTHVALAMGAMAAGKHVLIEKPLATSSAEAELLVDESRRRSVTLMVGHTFEHNPAVWKLRELIQTGVLGQIHYLDSARLNLGLYQSDVNVIWDLAPHDVSIFNYILDSQPNTVQAWGSRHAHLSLEDVAYLRLWYSAPNVTANIHVSWLDPCKVRRVTAVGSRRMVVYNDLAAEERIRVFDKGVTQAEDTGDAGQIPMSYRYGDISSPYLVSPEPLDVQDRHFVSCILEAKVPSTDGENGVAVVRVLEAAQISLLENRPVALGESALTQQTPHLARATG